MTDLLSAFTCSPLPWPHRRHMAMAKSLAVKDLRAHLPQKGRKTNHGPSARKETGNGTC